MAPPVEVSFCATNLDTEDRLPGALASVHALGAGLGLPYEVVVADGPSEAPARDFLTSWAHQHPQFVLVTHDERNRGYGRRRAFEASTGATVVPFDTSLAYAPEYSSLLRAWLGLRTDRMLFSEICALSRRSIVDSGGWRDFVGGEDLDLYGRVIDRFGLVAYPSAETHSQSARLGAFARQMRYVRGGGWARFRRIYAVQRDQIAAVDYRIADLLAFNRRKPWPRRVAYAGFFALAALGARLGRLRPVRLSRNHYLILREETFRSLLAGGFRELGWDGRPPVLRLSADEFTYLDARSAFYRQHRDELRPFLALK